MRNSRRGFDTQSTQPKLQLVTTENLGSQEIVQSIIKLTQQMIRQRSQGGIDDPTKCIDEVSSWLADRNVEAEVLTDRGSSGRRKIGLSARLAFRSPGPTICLMACIDTAPFGSLGLWTHPPTGARIENGRLFGRGAADSKVAAAIFSHIILELKQRATALRGSLILLLDADEHTGRFGAIKGFLSKYRDIDGAFIGYPGNHVIKIGARGFVRARLRFWAPSGHTGSRNSPSVNVFEKVGWFVRQLQDIDLSDRFSEEYQMSPKITVTAMHGGGGYTSYADSCSVNIDARLVPGFEAREFRSIVADLVRQCDEKFPFEKSTSSRFFASWPPYKLDRERKIVQLLKKHAEMSFGHPVGLELSGPSNVGNYLASMGVDATCGFGVTGGQLHAADEYIEISTIEPTFQAYLGTVLELLS